MEIQFFPSKTFMHCQRVLTSWWSPFKWLTFCQNSPTCCYFLPERKLNFHFLFSPIFWYCLCTPRFDKWSVRCIRQQPRALCVLCGTGDEVHHCWTTCHCCKLLQVNFCCKLVQFCFFWNKDARSCFSCDNLVHVCGVAVWCIFVSLLLIGVFLCVVSQCNACTYVQYKCVTLIQCAAVTKRLKNIA